MSLPEINTGNFAPGRVVTVAPDGKTLIAMSMSEAAAQGLQILSSLSDVPGYEEGKIIKIVGGVPKWVPDSHTGASFTGLDDTPADYVGEAGRILVPNGAETALVFVDNYSTFIQMSDTPGAYAGQAGKTPRVNGAEDALVFDDTYSTFLSLDDTPGSITAGEFVKGNVGGDALDFGVPPNTDAWTDLTDTAGAITALELVRGNVGGTDLEFVDPADLVPENTVTVAQSGGKFTDIQLAIDSISDASITKQYVVLVYGGRYTITAPIVLKPNVTVTGISRDSVDIYTTSDIDVVDLTAGGTVENLQLQTSGASTGAKYAILCGAKSPRIKNIRIGCQKSATRRGVSVDGGGAPYIDGCEITCHSNGVYSLNSSPTILNSYIDTSTSGNAVYLDGSGTTRIVSSFLKGHTYALYSAGVMLKCANVIFEQGYNNANGRGIWINGPGNSTELYGCIVKIQPAANYSIYAAAGSTNLHVSNTSLQKGAVSYINSNIIVTDLDRVDMNENIWTYREQWLGADQQGGIRYNSDKMQLTEDGGSNWIDVLDRLKNVSTTGVLTGGVLSVGAPNTTVSVSDGTGFVVNNYTDAGNPIFTFVSWTGLTNIPVTDIGSAIRTYCSINSSGNLVQQTVEYTPENRRDLMIVGKAIHDDLATVSHTHPDKFTAYDTGQLLGDLMATLGVINDEGNTFFPNAGGNKTVDYTPGRLLFRGVNSDADAANPNYEDTDGATATTFAYWYRDGGTGWTEVGAQTDVDGANYDDDSGALQSVGANNFTIQHWYLHRDATDKVNVIYGQKIYSTLDIAMRGVNDDFEIPPAIYDSNRRLSLIVKGNMSDLTSVLQAAFITRGKLGEGGGGGSGSAVGATTFTGLSDTPGSITALYYQKGNAGGTALENVQYTTADDLVVGSDADGDTYHRAAGVLTRLAKSADGEVMTLASGVPSWAASAAGVTTFAALTDTAGETAREIQVGNAAGDGLEPLTQPTEDSFLIWNDGTNVHEYIPLQIGSISESELIGETVPLTADTPKAVYAQVSDGKLIRASAAAANDAAYRFAGFIAGAAYTADDTVVLIGYGKVDFDGALTPGAKYYLQDAVGTIGTSAGTIDIPVGISTTGGDLLTYPQPLRTAAVDDDSFAVTTGEAYSIGHVLYQKQADGKYYKAVALAAGEAAKGACVVALEASTGADESKLVTGGVGKLLTVLVGTWSAGDILYLTDTAGVINDFAGVGAVTQRFAQAQSTTVVRQIWGGDVLAL